VKILDFGIARARWEGLEYSNVSINFGSLGYMSPERFAGINTQAADVYSLGVVLFEMLTRKRMGKTSARAERHENRLDAAMELLRAKNPDCRDDLCALARRLLAHEAEDRPDHAFVSHACRHMAGDYEPRLRAWARTRVPPILRDLEFKYRRDLEPGLVDAVRLEDADGGKIPVASPLPRRLGRPDDATTEDI
jgi:serine/threonine protein kinase